MFCPVCNSEYRPGFTRCEPCGANLVETLDAGAADTSSSSVALATTAAGQGPLADFCGFLDLSSARQERDRLREHGILARISIRETPPGHLDGPVNEEYWLRVPQAQIRRVETIVGIDHVVDTDDGSVLCSGCGKEVPEEEPVCPHCGATFEDGP
jgi:hypothetical protein